MSHEIESDFVSEWGNEITQCKNCTSFCHKDGEPYCNEAQAVVPENGHCDFFKSLD